jgi:hypothetical protein
MRKAGTPQAAAAAISLRAFDPDRERGCDPLRAALLENPRRLRQERLRKQHQRPRPDGGQKLGLPWRHEPNRSDPGRLEKCRELRFHVVGQRAHHQQRAHVARRHDGGHRGQAGILALREGGLDPAARIAQHSRARHEPGLQPCSRPRQIELDHLGRAGAHQEQQPVDDTVELLVQIGPSGEIALLDDRGRETRLGEDHHAGRRLQQMRAGPRTDDEKECALDFAMQPDDPGQAAEDFALAPLAEHRCRSAAGLVVGERDTHPATCIEDATAGMERRAARSFITNCPALTT